MAKTSKMFVVKAVTESKDGKRKFFNEVGRAFLNDGEKGQTIKVILSMFPDLELVAFPAEAKDEAPAGE